MSNLDQEELIYNVSIAKQKERLAIMAGCCKEPNNTGEIKVENPVIQRLIAQLEEEIASWKDICKELKEINKYWKDRVDQLTPDKQCADAALKESTARHL
jgi:hypothetical protein